MLCRCIVYLAAYGRAGEKHESELTCIDTSTEEVRYHTAELQCFLLNKSIRAAFFRFVMVTTSFDSLLDQCTCFRTRQTAHLSRSSPGVGFHPNHPNQGFIRVYIICCNCANWFQNRTVLYIIAHYLQPSPTLSPVSRTSEPLDFQGVPLCFGSVIPRRTPPPAWKALADSYHSYSYGNTAPFVGSVGDTFFAIWCLQIFRLTGSQTFIICHCI